MIESQKPPSLTLSKPIIFLIWIGLLIITTLIFNNVIEQQHNPNQDLRISVNEFGNPEVTLLRNKYGHYVTSGEINNHPVTFLLDTGATLIAIPEHIANQLELTKGDSFLTETANGNSVSYRTNLEKVSLGDIVMNNVPASISSGMQFDEILLGMSFLKHLKMTQQGKQLTLSIH
jgi:aspartyl protease family protein